MIQLVTLLEIHFVSESIQHLEGKGQSAMQSPETALSHSS